MALQRALLLLICACAAVGSATREPVRARHAMVASAEPHATRAGLDVLREGGNAVDAAVAVGLTLAVTHPTAGNLGGGGFMLIRFPDGRSTFLDFRETAPAAASREMYLNAAGEATDRSVVGYQAVGVPGSVRGFAMARQKYGSNSWKRLIAPARELARKGFELPWGMARAMRTNDRLGQFPESRRIFQRGGGFFEYGDRFVQRDLAATLDRLSKRGPEEFYTGETARRIAADMGANGGLITLADLAAYTPKERPPLQGSYRGYDLISAPPASSGGAGVIQMLNMLETTRYFESGAGSADAIHIVAEAMRRFFADRAEFFGDTDFAVDVPLEKLISKDYAQARARTIDPQRATPSSEISAGPALGLESSETTHYSVVDEQGMAVAVTYTLNGSFGSGVTAKGTGIVLNNEMDDFTSKPGSPNQFGLLQSERNAIEPGKRPLSAMTPTIVSKDGKLFLVVGSPGGPKIISTVLQTILNVIDFDMDVQQAVDFPRFHHQWMPDELWMESWGFSPDTLRLLKEKGHQLEPGGETGRAMAIQVVDDGLEGAADARSEGLAAGF